MLSVSIALPVVLWLAGAQSSVIDLTSAPSERAQWRIVSSLSEGPIGAWPSSASMAPVTIRLGDCTINGANLYFSVEIDNNREFEVGVPINPDWKVFERPESISFREMLISLGTAATDGVTFKTYSTLEPFSLFGSRAVPGTMRILAPGEHLSLKLKLNLRSEHLDLSKLRVQVAGSDVTLSAIDDGYAERRSWIPALFTTSQPTSSGAEHEAR